MKTSATASLSSLVIDRRRIDRRRGDRQVARVGTVGPMASCTGRPRATCRSPLQGGVLALAAIFISFIAAGAGRAQDVTAIFTPTADGFIYSMPGLDAAAAVASAAEAGAAAADVAFSQSLVGNQVVESNVERNVAFTGSGQYNAGIVSINQDAGNFSNQANLRAIAIVEGDAPLHLAYVLGAAEMTGNSVVSGGPRTTVIDDSFHGTIGIVGINQSAGNLNQQLNAVAITAGPSLGPELIALGDSALESIGGQADNTLVEDPTSPRQAVLNNSFEGFVGIAQVNQSPGDMNSVANTFGLSVLQLGAP